MQQRDLPGRGQVCDSARHVPAAHTGIIVMTTPSGGGAGIRTAERSSLEIKDLLRKLHPSAGNHKDRIRRLNKFRNYVQPDVRVVILYILQLLFVFGTVMGLQ
jgi:hypothetical protein